MRIAMLGLGFMGSTHLKAYGNVSGAEIAAVVSDDPVALSGDLSHIQGNIGGPGDKLDFSNVRKYSSLDDFLAGGNADVDGVDVCLPTQLHASAAIQALRSGKHVLVEKPMALTGNLCDEMIREAEKSGRILMTAQVLRFFPAYLPLTDLIKGGRLGPVRSAVFRRRCAAPGWSKWLADPSQSGGGVFDLLIHDVDQCVDLFGVPEKISATGHVDLQRGIDQITAQLFYPGVGSVVVTGGWHHPKAYPFSMEYTISGDNGTVEYSSAGRDPAWYTPDGETQMLPLAEKDGFEAEIQYWVGCCNSNRKPERCPPEESALSVKLMWALVEARERNGEKVDCKL